MIEDETKLTDIREERKLSFLASAVESSDDAIIGMTLHGIMLSWNSGAQEIYGYSSDEVIGKSISILVPSDRIDEMSSLLKRAGQGESIKSFETVHVRKDGKQIYVSLTVSSVKEATGRIIGISSIARDITEHKRVEEAIRFENAFRKAIEDSMLSGVAAVDLAGRQIYVNPAFCKMVGWSAEELLGATPPCLYWPPEEAETIRDAFKKIISGKAPPGGFELRFRRRNEERFYALVLISPLKDGKGRTTGWLLSVYDITERKRIEEALHEAEERYHTILEHTVEGIYQTTLDGRFVLINPAIAHVFGYESTEEFLSKVTNIKQLYVEPSRRDELIRLIQKYEALTGFEAELRRKDGSIIWISLNIRALRDISGRITALAGTIMDITERKRAEELSKAFYDINLTINSTLDFNEIMRKVVVEAAKAIGSDACNITFCRNGHWIVEYAYGLPQQVIGIVFSGEQATTSDLIENTKKPIAIKDVLSDERFRHWILKEYGVRSVLGIPLLMREEVIGILYFSYFSVKPSFSQAEIDFAEKLSVSVSLSMQNARLFEERKRTEEELRQRTAELARSNAELEQFAYMASHDLQEPLRMVSGFTQLLAKRYKGKLDKDADEFIGFIVDGSKRMQSMIEDLLTYSRVGTRGKPFEPTDLEIVLDQVMINLKVAIEENKAVITHDPLPTVMADPTQMIQLFQNLIGNAIKFRKKEEPPRIHISAQRKGNEWLFSVKDNGIGIAPEFMGHLFQLFQRAAADYPGTGIGLALCKKIVERHGGRIWAESDIGKGSTFYFTIPVRKDELS